MKLTMKRLERDERLRELRYHTKGIIEAAENIAGVMKRLNDTYGRSAEEYAEALTLLQVEALDHLGYHLKHLRKPLARVQREAYAELHRDNAKKRERPSKRKAAPAHR